jgi:signal transduction histidine kinase
MGETSSDPVYPRLAARRRAGEVVREERSKTDERLEEERSTTDQSLREERLVTDSLLGADHEDLRVVEGVRESRMEAERALRDVRAESDLQLEKQADGLPEMSEKLEQAAETLSKAAVSLTGVAAILQDSSVDLVSNIAQIAADLKGTSGAAVAAAPAPAAPDASGTLTKQLADIADGLAEITSTLSEERKDADESLREEREVTDRLIVQELRQVEANLGQELRNERHALRHDRQATDADLANERRNTDDAVEHVQGLLADEKRDHAHTSQRAATRNEFLSIVSHDLRGPLTTITGIAALMDRPTASAEDQRGWAVRLRRSVGVMERLISDLLDCDSFEDGRLRIVAERLDTRSLVEGAIDAFHAVALAKGLSLEADLPAEPVITKHDPHRMLQVLSNLIQNAIKFTPEGGSIRVRVVRAGTLFQVSVSDTGIGIPDGDLTAIFERFRQLDRSDRTGLGLGLYISRWIVEAHGGTIWAESRAGGGTTFHFTLPEERRIP